MTITWEQVLAFLCEDQTMAITSLLFLAFFAAVALINYALPRVLRPYFLLAASYGFFCYDPVNRPLVGVLLGATAVSWLCGLIIGKVKVKPVRVLALLVTVLGGGWHPGLLQILEHAGRYPRRQHPQSPGQSAGTLGLSCLHLCGDELHNRCV